MPWIGRHAVHVTAALASFHFMVFGIVAGSTEGHEVQGLGRKCGRYKVWLAVVDAIAACQRGMAALAGIACIGQRLLAPFAPG
jgi:hypothetical protein